jgi:putative spermidine/putrescine transport system permease protein
MSAPRIGGAPGRVPTTVILLLVGVIFAIPLASMVEFTLRGASGGYGLEHWLALVDPENERKYRMLWAGIGNSLLLAIVTVVLMLVLLVPTMILVQLQFPRLRRALELICLLPITVPAIALVVGLAPVYSVIAGIFGSGAWTLSLAYGILVLPFAYRAIQSNLQAIDLGTLTEAARTLGASWATVVVRVIVPGLRRGLLAASVISIAVVLGEYTIASLLNRQNLQTALVQVSKSDPYTAVILSLLSLLFAFVLLAVIGRVGAGRPQNRTLL